MDELLQYLELQTKKVKQNTEILIYSNLPENLQFPLYHISLDPTIKTFIPRIPKTADMNDSETIPRICVSRDLIGAIEGLGQVDSNFVNGNYKYYIYAFDWSEVLVPNEKIANIDINSVGTELWITNHKKENVYNKPKIIGEIIVTDILFKASIVNKNNYNPNKELHFVAKLNESVPLIINQDKAELFKSSVPYMFVYEPMKKKYPQWDDSNLYYREISDDKFKELSKTKSDSNKLRSLEWIK